jgi:Zn-dependent protease
MGLISILFRDPLAFFILIPLLLYSLIAHEVSHGYVAYLFGDNTARYSGRLSFNPVSHIDPIGALMILLVGFGWANPVPVNYYNVRHYRVGLMCVALAGCAANILIATVALLLLQLGIGQGTLLESVLGITAHINIILGAFNLIPIPPLDGSKVLMSFLPADMQYKLSRIEPYGFFILAFLLFTGMLDPVISFVQGMILSAIGLVIGRL